MFGTGVTQIRSALFPVAYGAEAQRPRQDCSPARLPTVSVRAAVVRNASDVPQYGLPVYAVVRRGGRYVAAGAATVDDLGSRGSARVALSLIGDRRGGAITYEALPTIFR